MKLPIVWLKDYVDLKEISVDCLAERLSLAGFMLDKKFGDGDNLVLDFELRGNRAEMYSILGLARETAVLFNLLFNSPLLETKITENLPREDLITVDAKDLVNRFQAIYLKNIKIGPAPEFIRQRLALMGMPSINNVVDVTNYVMLETGQPLHAFDREKLAEKRLIVRTAKENEEFATLDGVLLKLNSGDLVIADVNKAMAFAGIVGGRDCAIDENTREIILEAANYDRVNVRRSSFLRNVRTEASTRLEKFLDPNLVDLANQRCVELLKKYAGAEAISWSDYYPRPVTPKIVKFDYKEVRRLTGIEIDPDRSKDILIRLGFKIEKTSETEWQVTVPTIRRDINEEADLVEEIVRIYGYDRLPSQLICEAPPEYLRSSEKEIEKEIKRILTACGFNEAITLPLINDRKMMAWGYAKEELIYLANPPGFDYNCLVASILPGLWEFWQISQQYQVGQNMFFEIGKTFSRKDEKYLEEEKLAILIGGENYGCLKGVLETIFEELGINDKARENLTRCIFQREGVICWEISVVELSKLPRQSRKYGLLPSYPLIKEDLTFVFKDKAKWSDIKEKIQQTSPLIAAVEWKGDYREDNGVARTITVIYQNRDKSLSDAEIAPLRKQIVEAVEKEFEVKLKGKLS